ncbi:hypothetical protein I2W78_19775 [Streptomyces spinoverrucosus]|uniref:hypothetical protein n=1 Tax=Streptomyces spinoverrucosus TaxID=284043 RepID=UPI0018C3A595|nr:hypothetical protein [Streptomyces spinoverrucosus]MBG0854025.1 hypothetical protein [Streptomyces spinoverrucosus]
MKESIWTRRLAIVVTSALLTGGALVPAGTAFAVSAPAMVTGDHKKDDKHTKERKDKAGHDDRDKHCRAGDATGGNGTGGDAEVCTSPGGIGTGGRGRGNCGGRSTDGTGTNGKNGPNCPEKPKQPDSHPDSTDTTTPDTSTPDTSTPDTSTSPVPPTGSTGSTDSETPVGPAPRPIPPDVVVK